MYGLLVLLIYTALMLGATFLLSRKAGTAESFHVADRRLGLWQSAMSIAATWIWAPALFTSAEKAYTTGWPGLFWFLVPNVLCLLVFVPFAQRIRVQMPEGVTVSGYMAEHYRSKPVHGVCLFELSVLTVLSTAVQLLAGAKILSAVTGWPFWLLTVVLAAIAFSYSQYSGIRASVLTDALQMLLMLGCCAFLVPLALRGNGAGSLVKGLAGATGEFTRLLDKNGLAVLLSFGLPSAIGLLAAPFGDQCFWQRAFSIRKDKMGKAYMSFSGGKDSLALAHLVYSLIQAGEINPALLTVVFIDEEAIFDCIEATTKAWRKKFMLAGAKFQWWCIEVKHFNCLNQLSNDESFVCWDSRKAAQWVRQPPGLCPVQPSQAAAQGGQLPDIPAPRHPRWYHALRGAGLGVCAALAIYVRAEHGPERHDGKQHHLPYL